MEHCRYDLFTTQNITFFVRFELLLFIPGINPCTPYFPEHIHTLVKQEGTDHDIRTVINKFFTLRVVLLCKEPHGGEAHL